MCRRKLQTSHLVLHVPQEHHLTAKEADRNPCGWPRPGKPAEQGAAQLLSMHLGLAHVEYAIASCAQASEEMFKLPGTVVAA